MTAPRTPKSKYPPNVPEKLVSKYLECESNMSRLARRLGVNKAHIHNLLVHGKEPKDKKLRKKLFLPAKSREGIPAWVIGATKYLTDLEEKSLTTQMRMYDRKGKRVK